MRAKPSFCLSCKTEMDAGWLMDPELGTRQAAEWIEDLPEGQAWLNGRTPMPAYRCPRCAQVVPLAQGVGKSVSVASLPDQPFPARARPGGARRRGMLHRTKRRTSKLVVAALNRVRGFLNHDCIWCQNQVLRRAEPFWWEHPLRIFGIGPYYCPHCFGRCYRFKRMAV